MSDLSHCPALQIQTALNGLSSLASSSLPTSPGQLSARGLGVPRRNIPISLCLVFQREQKISLQFGMAQRLLSVVCDCIELMRRTRYKEKVITKPNFNSDNQYLPLVPEDALYRPNLKQLKDPEFKIMLLKFTGDLNLLLMMDQQEFWKELEDNQSILISLESCLAVLPKREFDRYEGAGHIFLDKLDPRDPLIEMYSLLLKNVLLVYYRISCAQTKVEKEMLYDCWLIDVPKLLDLAGIYGPSNPAIVKQIILNTYKAHPNYDRDTLDFFSMVEEHDLLLPPEMRMVEIDFSPKSLSRKNFGNREKFMIQETARELFLIKDLLVNLTNLLVYFPSNYAHEFAVDFKIQERLLRGLAIHLKESSEDWKLGDHEKYFQWQLEDIRQTIARYFIQQFKALREILEGKGSSETDQLIDLAETTYETLCLCLSERQNKPESPYYRRMINQLIEHTDEPIFFVPARRIKDADARTHNSVEQCVDYQNRYRKERRLEGRAVEYDEVYQNFKKSLSRFKETTAKSDSAEVRKREQDLEDERRKREPADIYLTWFKMKYKYLNPEYYDDLEEEDQFRRAEDKEKNLVNNMVSTDINLNFKKKKQYLPKVPGERDPQLSVWDLSTITRRDMLLQQHSSTSKDSILFEQSKSIEESVGSRQEGISHFEDVLPGKAVEQSVDLSIFETEDRKHDPNDLSFSVMSSVKGEVEEEDYFRLQVGEEVEDDNKQIQSLLADINMSVCTPIKSKTQNADIGSEDGEFSLEEHLSFMWQADGELSFDLNFS